MLIGDLHGACIRRDPDTFLLSKLRFVAIAVPVPTQLETAETYNSGDTKGQNQVIEHRTCPPALKRPEQNALSN